MKRSDIDTGFILVNEVGTAFHVVNFRGKLYLMTNSFFISIKPITEMMDEDLNPVDGHYAIVEIKDTNNTSVWKKPIELTLQEIANRFGIPVEQLKIKK